MAIDFLGRDVTYAELDRRARLIAARLQLELSPGDRVNLEIDLVAVVGRAGEVLVIGPAGAE